MQALVIAHACYGHNLFFKNNYLFCSWTDASSIIDSFIFARKYITGGEERHGVDEVEKPRPCHALHLITALTAVKRLQKNLLAGGEGTAKALEEYSQSQVNMLWRTLPEARRGKTTLKCTPLSV